MVMLDQCSTEKSSLDSVLIIYHNLLNLLYAELTSSLKQYVQVELGECLEQ